MKEELNSLQQKTILLGDRKIELGRPVENHNIFLQEVVGFRQVLSIPEMSRQLSALARSI